MKILLHSILLAFAVCNASVMTAQLRLPAIIGSGMVLQQNDSATLWGWAGPSEKVNIVTSWNNQRYEASTDRNAHWSQKVKTPAAGGPYTITIETRGIPVVLEDVLIGEVWVCSGQSNMEWSYYNGEKDTREEMPNAANNQLRFFQVPKTTAAYPQEDVKAQWQHCDSNTLKAFSAVGYFFGKKLNSSLQVPIGLINASWGERRQKFGRRHPLSHQTMRFRPLLLNRNPGHGGPISQATPTMRCWHRLPLFRLPARFGTREKVIPEPMTLMHSCLRQ